MKKKAPDLIRRVQAILDEDHTSPAWSDLPWSDPGVSRRILAEHLNPNNDRASRAPATVAAECAFIDGIIGDTLGHPARVCDLTCGPGFYAMRLSAFGHRITGVDYSPAAIEYARNRAAEHQRAGVEFIQADVRQVDFPAASFDVVMMVYGQANAFERGDLEAILRSARRWISPDGVLVIELASRWVLLNDVGHWWAPFEKSVFSDEPHLWLEEKNFDRQLKRQTHRVFVVDAGGALVETARVCHMAYELPEVELLLREAGWRLEATFGSLTGDRYREDRSSWMVVVARPQSSED